ncbi:multidrug DMT transporter permease [Legionella bononiensis]|uniref:Multidrug DMT transporter permease n=1 Tax=Legionella bononiensis TaxID=2793102 RepID=A0ABS1WEF6_9GAMM|nr:multidrug DMT transporter permease [Legionella bononiensis]MBL7479382.1 multidrug DMT transporter permease [Legionella bononiensis]MBL7527744.1 multidrug DMT transporter permease [Legionella bononiensis]MBL7563573.1 multidrug DMT transporter permease [Legionella bononiensis]
MFRFLVIIASFVVISSNVYAADNPCNDHQCIAVIDAGSTGSRLHVYSYDVDETRSPVNINEIWNKKIKPGFATIEPNSNTIDAYLTTLLSGAPNQQIPVYFYATAGMRLLPVSKQKKYYDELQHWFSQQSQWQLVEAKTITGTDEALYDWLSVNYHLGTLQKSPNESVGVMDMGGASVQIVFPVQKNSELNTRSQVELELYGHHYNLYVQSFLGLGQTEVAHQFLNSASCFSNNYPLPDGESGQGNASACEQEVSRLMTEVHKVNNVVQPLLAANPVDSWYSIGGISNLADSSLFHFENSTLTNQNLLQQADSQVCHQQWDSINSQFPDDEYVYQYCLFSAYYYALMVDGYGIIPDQSINYIPPDQNLDWTMGVVLHH